MNLYFIGRGIVLKGIVKYYGSGKNIPRTFGHTDLMSDYDLRIPYFRSTRMLNNKRFLIFI